MTYKGEVGGGWLILCRGVPPAGQKIDPTGSWAFSKKVPNGTLKGEERHPIGYGEILKIVEHPYLPKSIKWPPRCVDDTVGYLSQCKSKIRRLLFIAINDMLHFPLYLLYREYS